jgi:hypothetical protein
MNENPYESPREAPLQRLGVRKKGVLLAIGLLALPALSIAGGATCSVTGSGLYRLLRLDPQLHYASGVLPSLLVGIACGTFVVVLLWSRVRNWARNRLAPDDRASLAEWTKVETFDVACAVFAAMLVSPLAVVAAYGAFLVAAFMEGTFGDQSVLTMILAWSFVGTVFFAVISVVVLLTIEVRVRRRTSI